MLKANEFKRSVHKTLSPKTAKEGFKTILRGQRGINLATEVLNTRVAASQLLQDYRGYVLGLQLNPVMKAKGVDSLGDVLHHAVNVAKLLKAKIPASQRKIKPKNTHTYLLTEIDRLAGDMLATLTAVPSQAKLVPMTDEERKVAEAKPKKAPPGKAKDGTPKVAKAPKFEKVVTGKLNEAALGQTATALLEVAYEFCWAVYEVPAAQVMGQHIEKLKPNFPEGFFNPPPKKAAPVKKDKLSEAKQVAAH